MRKLFRLIMQNKSVQIDTQIFFAAFGEKKSNQRRSDQTFCSRFWMKNNFDAGKFRRQETFIEDGYPKKRIITRNRHNKDWRKKTNDTAP